MCRNHQELGGWGNGPAKTPMVLRRFLASKDVGDRNPPWIVMDRDNWSPETLDRIQPCALAAEQHGLALNNPKFEFRLLLHLEDIRDKGSTRECTNRLERYLARFRKFVDCSKNSSDMIQDAVDRDRQRDQPLSACWPKQPCIGWLKNSIPVRNRISAVRNKSSLPFPLSFRLPALEPHGQIRNISKRC